MLRIRRCCLTEERSPWSSGEGGAPAGRSAAACEQSHMSPRVNECMCWFPQSAAGALALEH